MFTKQELQNLAALLQSAKFDGLTIPAAAVAVSLLHKVDQLAQAPEQNGGSNSSNDSKPSPDQPA